MRPAFWAGTPLYSLHAAPRGGDLQAGMSSMVCVLESGAQPISYSRAYPLASAAYSFPWEKVIHCFLTRLTLSTLVALCGYTVGFSCSLARWQLSFHFKKAEVKGIVLILLQLQEFFYCKIKGKIFLGQPFSLPCYWHIHILPMSTGWKCLCLFIWLMVWFLFLYG